MPVAKLYLIEILHQTTTFQLAALPVVLLYLIEILHQTTTGTYDNIEESRLYLIEILHQTTTISGALGQLFGLYLIEILHQTTTCGQCEDCLRRCILSKFYIKPQLSRRWHYFCWVVSYRNSTSNHNISTFRSVSIMLYLIEILHQTTTRGYPFGLLGCCILSKFYIKPQPRT